MTWLTKYRALVYETETEHEGETVHTTRTLLAVTTAPNPNWLRLRRWVHVALFGWSS